MAYVYFIKNKTTGHKYIGSKSGKNCNPDLFWVTYFTSSKLVKVLIDLYGKDDFYYKIIKNFDNDYDVLKYERFLIDLSYSKNDYLNLHPNFIRNMTKEKYEYNKAKQKEIAKYQGLLSYKNKTGIHKLSKKKRKK